MQNPHWTYFVNYPSVSAQEPAPWPTVPEHTRNLRQACCPLNLTDRMLSDSGVNVPQDHSQASAWTLNPQADTGLLTSCVLMSAP